MRTLRPVYKRMAILMVCLAVALNMSACGAAFPKKVNLSEAAASGDSVEELLSKMTLRQKIEQMMIVSYRIWKELPEKNDTDINQTVENAEAGIPEVNVTELNDKIRTDIRLHNYGGTVLFAQNYKDAEQTLRLVSDIQKTSVDSGSLPLIVSTDQEGGSVARITFGTNGVGNMALAATGDPQNARRMAAIYGEELSLLGVNTDLAPVVDVNSNPENPVIGVRSFSDDPKTVSEYGLAYMEGLKETGTIATLKHFPGHGNTDTDSHTGFPCINSSLEELRQCELVPFKKLVDEGVDMVMTAHIQYPKIETRTYTSASTGEEIYLPATMSRTIMTELLRDEMGFEGVSVTDALDMAAIADNFETEDVIKMTINAGVNMLMLPIITDTDIFKKTHEMVDMAVKLAACGEIDMAAVDDSVRRILKLKEKYGILRRNDFTVTDEQIDAAVDGIGGPERAGDVRGIASDALTLLKNDGDAFPVKMSEGEEALILFADSCASRVAAADMAKEFVYNEGLVPQGSDISVMVNTRDNEAECLEAARTADHVVLVYRTYNSACLDPSTDDGFSSAVFDRIMEERHKDDKRVILISCQLPYDAARFTDADAILLSYNSSAMKEVPPVKGEGSAFIPNLPVAIEAVFGASEPRGSLPVKVPVIDGNYKITDKILYEGR
ncbi:MAG: glycoside hydrolase family 3 protein [Lachnospiraceae bacterium]|nr:glycoside hydrolase family 3 protein [Lachnospiraceae bacterium]